jgi:hypothetical protein
VAKLAMTDRSSAGILHSLYLAGFRMFMSVVEKNLVPDFIVRAGIRYLLSVRAKAVAPASVQLQPSQRPTYTCPSYTDCSII